VLDEKQKEKLRTLTVELLLELRASYLASPGANTLKHWDQLQERMRAAARTTASPEEWATKMRRDLNLPAPSSSGSKALVELVHAVTEKSARRDWLDMLDKEHGYLIALTRLSAEKRKEARDAVRTEEV
jgi:hypothetical protein